MRQCGKYGGARQDTDDVNGECASHAAELRQQKHTQNT